MVEEYFVNPTDLFDRRKHSLTDTTDLNRPRYDVKIIEDDEHVEVQFSKNAVRCEKASVVSIAGLKKYLPDYSTCTLIADVDSLRDVFHAWAAVEDALISRSRFFSLIDIYGHYANKGDDVCVSSDWRFATSSAVTRLLNLFGDTDACGEFRSRSLLARNLGISDRSLSEAVVEMRRFRFDVRTSDTHPIIDDALILCTYPFPLLSPRALVESKAKIIRVRNEQAAPKSVAAG